MKNVSIVLLLMLTVASLHAEKYKTQSGKISFTSTAPLQTITAISSNVSCLLDSDTGTLAFQLPVKAFQFDKALMQEKFNEDYMQSGQFPKSTFQGKIEDPGKVSFSQNGTYPVKANGKLTIHNVTKDVTVPGTLVVKDGKVALNAKFSIKLSDYGITVPAMHKEHIAEDIEITVDSSLSPGK